MSSKRTYVRVNNILDNNLLVSRDLPIIVDKRGRIKTRYK